MLKAVETQREAYGFQTVGSQGLQRIASGKAAVHAENLQAHKTINTDKNLEVNEKKRGCHLPAPTTKLMLNVDLC